MAIIVAVRKDGTGSLTEFKLDDGRELDFNQCYSAIQGGEVRGVVATTGKEGVAIIRGQADGDPANNLSNLPMF